MSSARRRSPGRGTGSSCPTRRALPRSLRGSVRSMRLVPPSRRAPTRNAIPSHRLVLVDEPPHVGSHEPTNWPSCSLSATAASGLPQGRPRIGASRSRGSFVFGGRTPSRRTRRREPRVPPVGSRSGSKIVISIPAAAELESSGRSNVASASKSIPWCRRIDRGHQLRIEHVGVDVDPVSSVSVMVAKALGASSAGSAAMSPARKVRMRASASSGACRSSSRMPMTTTFHHRRAAPGRRGARACRRGRSRVRVPRQPPRRPRRHSRVAEVRVAVNENRSAPTAPAKGEQVAEEDAAVTAEDDQEDAVVDHLADPIGQMQRVRVDRLAVAHARTGRQAT